MKKRKTKSNKKGVIKSYFKIMGVRYSGSGNTVEKAITSLNPKIVRGMGVLTLERGRQKREKILNKSLVMRLFGQVSRFNKEIAWKQVNQMFQGL